MDLRRMATMLVAGVAVVGLSVGVSGCGRSDGIVTETPSPTSVTTPLASPSPSPSATSSPAVSGVPLSDDELLEILPEYADRTDLQGAVVTAEFFIQEFPRMMSSGDTTVWDSLSLPGCEFCASGRTSALNNADNFVSVRGGDISQGLSITEANLLEDGRVEVKYPVHVAKVFTTEAGKAEVVSVEPRDGTFTLLAELIGDVWRISAVRSEAS